MVRAADGECHLVAGAPTLARRQRPSACWRARVWSPQRAVPEGLGECAGGGGGHESDGLHTGRECMQYLAASFGS